MPQGSSSGLRPGDAAGRRCDGGLGGKPLRDLELLKWCTELVEAVFEPHRRRTEPKERSRPAPGPSAGPGAGATFTVTLPRHDVLPRVDVSPPSEVIISRSYGRTGGQLAALHVLVVDEQDDARDLLATVLEDAGASVTQADSATAAITALAREDVSVIVADLGMLTDDGYPFLRRVRAQGETLRVRGVPALALTGHARHEDRVRALAAGFQANLPRTASPSRLVSVVASIARGS